MPCMAGSGYARLAHRLSECEDAIQAHLGNMGRRIFERFFEDTAELQVKEKEAFLQAALSPGPERSHV